MPITGTRLCALGWTRGCVTEEQRGIFARLAGFVLACFVSTVTPGELRTHLSYSQSSARWPVAASLVLRNIEVKHAARACNDIGRYARCRGSVCTCPSTSTPRRYTRPSHPRPPFPVIPHAPIPGLSSVPRGTIAAQATMRSGKGGIRHSMCKESCVVSRVLKLWAMRPPRVRESLPVPHSPFLPLPCFSSPSGALPLITGAFHRGVWRVAADNGSLSQDAGFWGGGVQAATR